MKISAGAPASICFASAELAAYDTTTRSLDAARNALTFASSASFKLAAANTVIVSEATAGATGIVAISAGNRTCRSLALISTPRNHCFELSLFDPKVGYLPGRPGVSLFTRDNQSQRTFVARQWSTVLQEA